MRVLAVAGSSGGHIFPALAFLEALKEKYAQGPAVLLLPKKSAVKNITNCACEIKYLPEFSFKPGLRRENFSSALNFFKASFLSLRILYRFKPDVVVGFGSRVSLPVIIIAWLLRVKTIIHEQNVGLGRANRFLCLFADRVAVSFAQTKVNLGGFTSKIVVTGNPLRKSLKLIDRQEARDFFGFKEDKFTLLVSGGSQGSHKINTEILKAVSLFPDRSLLQVIHLSGRSDYELLKDGYKQLDVKVALFDFLEEMQYAYSAADLAISRSGATTIAELIYYRLPAILVPYPYAYKHQYENARALAGNGGSIIIHDALFNAAELKERLGAIFLNRKKWEVMRPGFSSPHLADAANSLVKEAAILNYA